jgi:hypothetical protein
MRKSETLRLVKRRSINFTPSAQLSMRYQLFQMGIQGSPAFQEAPHHAGALATRARRRRPLDSAPARTDA